MIAKHPPTLPRTPLFAAAALCHLLVLGLVIDTRLHLHLADRPASSKSTARRGLSAADGGSSSAPLNDDDDDDDGGGGGGAGGDSFATAAELAELKAALTKQIDTLSTLKTDTAELGRQHEGLSQTRTRDDSDSDDEMLDRFMTSMRAEMAELKTELSQRKANQTGTVDRIVPVERPQGAMDAPAQTASMMWREIDGLKAENLRSSLLLRNISQSLEEMRPRHVQDKLGGVRKLQGGEPEPEPEPALGEFVQQIKREVVRCGGPGATTVDGSFDYSRCAVRTFSQCNAEACAGHTGSGHRRAQTSCSANEVAERSAEVTAECCDEIGENCDDGYPHTCNSRCAEVFLPFWRDCRGALGKGSGRFEPVVEMCEAAVPLPPPPPTADGGSFAQQLSVACADESFSHEECVPVCTATLHGFLLLLNIDGNDSKLSCELHHGLYSWMGEATDGECRF